MVYKLLQVIGDPTTKLKKLIKEWKVPYRKLRYVDYVRYYYIGNLYQKPSHIIKTLYKISKYKEEFLGIFKIKILQSENLFEDVLRQLKIEDTIDHSVGFKFLKKIGAEVKKGETIIIVYYNDKEKLKNSLNRLEPAIKISSEKVNMPELIKETII